MEEKQPVYYIDSILRALNPRGTYQIFQLLVVTLLNLPAAFHLLSNVFTALENPTRCAAPKNKTEFLSSYEIYSNATITYDECNILVHSDNNLVLEVSCIFGRTFEWPKDFSSGSDFDLVCEKKSLDSLSQTLVILGQGFGAVIATTVADRFGRKPVLIGSGVALIGCGLALAFSPVYAMYAAFKFLSGGFQQGLVTSGITMMLETVIMKDRRLPSVLQGVAWGLSSMSMSAVAYLLQDRLYSWRIVQIAFTATSVIVILQWWYLDESLRWLIANGKSDQVIKLLHRAAKTNGTDVNAVMQAYEKGAQSSTAEMEKKDEDASTTSKKIPNTATKKMTLLDLLRVKRLLINAMAIWFGWFTAALGFFALYLTATSLSGNKYVNFTLTSAMEIPPTIFYFFFLNRIGRKMSTVVMFSTLSVGLISTGILKSFEENDFTNGFALFTSLVSMLGAAGSFAIVFTYTPELFPTNVRNQALGVSSFMGRIGGMLAPFTGVLADQAKWAPGVLIGGFATVTCLLLTVLPETKNRELPQTIEELNSWYQKDPSKKAKRRHPELDRLDMEIIIEVDTGKDTEKNTEKETAIDTENDTTLDSEGNADTDTKIDNQKDIEAETGNEHKEDNEKENE